MHASGAFEQDGVAGCGQRARQAARLLWVLEKKRGVGPKAGTLGCVQHMTGGAAYSYEHIKPLSAA